MKVFNLAILFVAAASAFVACRKRNASPPPSIEIVSPIYTGSTICNNVNIRVNAIAADGTTISKVSFFVDDSLVGSAITAPYSFVFTAAGKFGQVRQITATVYDDQGHSTSDTVSVAIWNGVEKTAMTVSRYCFTAEAVNGKIYVIGGYDTCNRLLEEYDPVKDVWVRKASSHWGHAAHASCVINNKIYVFGGDAGYNWMPYSEVYDPVTDAWTDIDSIPFADSVGIGNMACVAFGGKAYIFGGIATNPSYVRVGEYDPATNGWRALSRKSTFAAAGAPFDGHLWFLGGCSVNAIGLCSQPSNEALTFEVSTGAWTAMPAMVYQHSGHCACVAGNRLYAIGGVPNESNCNMEVYDAATGAWAALPPMPTGQVNFGCCEVNGKIYIIGTHVYEYTPL